MQQYHAAKQEHPDCLLFFRLGDFFELFFEDAITASSDLEITLTKRRNGKGEPIPMCGVPVHAADGYLARLLQRGHRVAICDQVEEPKAGRGLVKRRVVRVLTPGTASDNKLLESGRNNYLAAVHPRDGTCGFAYADVSTGEFRAVELDPSEIDDMLESIGAKELLRAGEGPITDASRDGDGIAPNDSYIVSNLDSWVFDFEYAERLLLETFGLHNLEGLGMARRPVAVSAAGALLHYLKETQRTALPHLDRPTYLAQKDWMVLDPVTIRHLELFDPLFEDPRTTLLHTLDRTATPMGKRLLRARLLRPSLDAYEVELRLEAVASLCGDAIVRTEIQRELVRLHDVERLLSRIALGSAGPREVYNLGTSLARVPTIREFTSRLSSRRAASLMDAMDTLEDVCERILSTLAAEPPVNLKAGDAIAEGFDSELDELRSIQRNSRSFIARLERREREATGIESLKVRFNKVFGFFIEVSRSNLASVPDRFDRKQTLVNAERFTTPELKELEAKVLDAEDRIAARAAEIFEDLRAGIVDHAARVRRTARALAEIDVLQGLAHVAIEQDYVRPSFSSEGEIQIEGGRHPVVERMLQDQRGERFINNDVYLDGKDNLLAIITGPNMGGKSTYLRQTALISLMAQSGSFVPASKAVLPMVDRIFTRIGASDNVALGRSTFMVEMTETAPDPESRDRPQPDPAGRDRSRNGDLRRPSDRMGGCRVHPLEGARKDAIRHPLPRIDHSRVRQHWRVQPPRLRKTVGRPPVLSSPHPAGHCGPQLRHRGRPARRPAKVSARTRHPSARRTRTSRIGATGKSSRRGGLEAGIDLRSAAGQGGGGTEESRSHEHQPIRGSLALARVEGRLRGIANPIGSNLPPPRNGRNPTLGQCRELECPSKSDSD